ncbi:bifunctional (p)ppGpp synthetase/guanosine-3',5'-bis(diphosphate) 3'-pyrophosphohydrolase [Patescibacteria group bacterium]|nr:MAG: bifunctional (p)ppGpp synthetase/guanosine-3',5'-bis(diphosphate) 3'-pyrophosphohydrolase [Patescibacteria group bacterium]
MDDVQSIISLLHSPSEKDRALIAQAFAFAAEVHKSHVRLSGEPYIIHPVETVKILAEYGMGATTIAAGLLHDSIEDGNIEPKIIESEFGEEVLFLVEGVTKLGSLKYRGADRHNESLRKLFVAMSRDIRVLMIKLADRLHNMRTLSFVPEEKRVRIARETLEIYAPIAYRLGIRKLSRELEDLAFPFVYPKEYEEVRGAAAERRKKQEESLQKFLKSVKKALAKEEITRVRTEYRVKGLYSLWKKLHAREKNIDEVYDILALRVVVPTVQDCYRVLGAIHASWRPLPHQIDDYIAFPKPNGYQALHTTVFTGDGNIVEVQIKTEAMYQNAEYGIASHISYKEGKMKGEIPASLVWAGALLPQGATPRETVNPNTLHKDVPQWINELVSHHEEEASVDVFNHGLRSDFFQHRIFIFTPKGDVVDLPKESSPVDFAYAIHSDIGSHMTGAKVNGKLVSLDTHLQNGDIVEIVTKLSAHPTAKWLEYVKTSLARRRIKASVQKQS